MKQIRKVILVLAIISLGFENAVFLSGSITLSFVLFLSYIMLCLPLYGWALPRVLSKYKKILIPLAIFYIILIFSNINNNSNGYYPVFPMSLTACILLFITLLVHNESDKSIVNLFWAYYPIGMLLLVMCYYLNIGVTYEGHDSRLSLFGLNPNNLGYLISIALAVISYQWLYLKKNTRFPRFVVLFFILISFILILTTGSRSSLSALALLLVIAVVFTKTENKLSHMFLLIVGVIVMYVGANYVQSSSVMYERILRSIQDQDTSNREIIWGLLITRVSDHPLWGVGQTGYATIAGTLFGNDEINGAASPHNVCLEVALYTGIVGLFCMLLFWINIITKAIKYSQKTRDLTNVLILIPIIIMILNGQALLFKAVWIVFAQITISHNNEMYLTKSNS